MKSEPGSRPYEYYKVYLNQTYQRTAYSIYASYGNSQQKNKKEIDDNLKRIKEVLGNREKRGPYIVNNVYNHITNEVTLSAGGCGPRRLVPSYISKLMKRFI